MHRVEHEPAAGRKILYPLPDLIPHICKLFVGMCLFKLEFSAERTSRQYPTCIDLEFFEHVIVHTGKPCTRSNNSVFLFSRPR